MAELDKTAIVILGNQLLAEHPALKKYPSSNIIMIEADNLFKKHNYHKHKLILIMASMRNYKKYLKNEKRNLIYVELKRGSNFNSELESIIKSRRFNKLVWMSSSDKGPNAGLRRPDIACAVPTFINRELVINNIAKSPEVVYLKSFSRCFNSPQFLRLSNFFIGIHLSSICKR